MGRAAAPHVLPVRVEGLWAGWQPPGISPELSPMIQHSGFALQS